MLCGALVLSEADNWYVPGRLTPEMSKLLDTTDLPFGRVVQTLHFQRHTLSSTLLWQPLPEGWEMNAGVTQRRRGDPISAAEAIGASSSADFARRHAVQ